MELRGGKEVHPFSWIIGAEDTEISFDLLIGLLSLSVRLGVVCSGEFDVVLEEACQLSGEGRCELWSSVRD